MIGSIYKISNTIDDRLYIGSTFNSVNQRFHQHKTNSRCETRKNYNGVLYVAMRELGEDKFRIEVIETVECKDKDELHTHEQRHIDELKPIFNYQKAHHTAETKKIWRKQYEKNRAENRTEEEKLANNERIKKWHTDNKAHVKEYKKQHYLKNKTAIADKHKSYYEANKEHLKAKAKLYAKATPKIKTLCECGGSYMTGQKNRHCQTDLHKNWILYQAMTPEEKEEDRLRIIAIKEQKRLDANMKRRKPKV